MNEYIAKLEELNYKWKIENGVLMIFAPKSDEAKIKKLMKGYCKSYGIRFNDRVREEM